MTSKKLPAKMIETESVMMYLPFEGPIFENQEVPEPVQINSLNRMVFECELQIAAAVGAVDATIKQAYPGRYTVEINFEYNQ